MSDKMTQQEQIGLVNGASFFGSGGVERLGIDKLQLLDGGTGINFEQLFGDFLSRDGLEGIGGDALRDVLKNFYSPESLQNDGSKKLYEFIVKKLDERNPKWQPPGCYPPGILLGATWNPETVCAVGQALGDEALSFGVNVLLGTPNVNLHRDIRNGRLFEGYSEDPCLASKLAPCLVKGVQSKGVAANVKHFAANNQETNRMDIDEQIPERALFELYFPAFRACVDAKVATVMSAYNRINGIPCTENKWLLNELLRKKWGFEGVVISDWNAVYHPQAAVNAGNDLAMPGPISPQTLNTGLENGTLSPSALETSANRVAQLSRKYAKPAQGEVSLELTDAIAYDAAAEGIVLLKNLDNALPLDSSAKISLMGKNCEYMLTCGEGSAGINTNRNISLYNALQKRFDSVIMHSCDNSTDTLIYVYSLEGREGNDLRDISIKPECLAELEAILHTADDNGMKKVLVLNVSAPVDITELQKRFDAVICVFLPGMQGANALADVLCGKLNPSGRLPLSWPARIEDMPTYLNFPGDGMQVCYGEGIFVGYRWYDARKIKPLYHFGHGLSFTEFEIESICADKQTFTDSITIKVNVKNIGERAGKTVVQLYVGDIESTLTKPVKELKAFEKIHLEKGETKQIVFNLSKADFESYDPNLHQFATEEGFYEISAGFSSGDLRASCKVYVDVESPYSYGAKTQVKTIMENPQLKKCVKSFFDENSLQWSGMLTSYEYTSQDELEKILDMQGCQTADSLYDELRKIKKQ
ncbi:MAG: glycoside hydrolase family 3 C-terminal domain-containing protein [Oscillospiraceae bacterium]|nr:glycoside hydrolase family 3 C-terminal domain-containing protein [Oscillospiraceae bacterium]